MSRMGPPGGYPDQPDPYRHPDPYGQPPPYDPPGQPGYPRQPSGWRGGDDPYGPPADPWGGPPGQGGGQPGGWGDLTTPQPPHRDTPTAAQPPYRPTDHRGYQPPWEPEPEPPSRRRTGLVVLLVAALVLVVGGGVFATLQWVSNMEPDGTPAAQDTGPSGSPEATGTGAPSEEPEDEGPEARIGLSAVVVEPDDCMVNDGSDVEPEMRIVACDTEEEGDAAIYRVLSRFDEPIEGESEEEWDQSAQRTCADTEGYELHYRFVADDPDDSFVLCMAEQ